MIKKGLLLIGLATLMFVGCGKKENKQGVIKNFPEKNIKIIVPFAAGGGVDTNTRILADVGSDLMNGYKFIVENKPGSGAIVGLTYAKNAKPDGYTLGATSYSMISKPILIKDSTFKTEDFSPIALMTTDGTVLAVPTNSPINTFKDFIKLSKEKEITVNTSGFKGGPHIAGVKISNAINSKLNFVHTDGATVQIPQLLGGHIDAGILTVGEAEKLYSDHKIKILGVTTADRSPILKDIPTFKELGYNVQYEVFRGFSAPKGTPKETLDKLEKIFKDIITSDEFKTKMESAGNLVNYKGQKDFKELVKNESESLKAIESQL
ncbi:MAG: tripartite tricarboxylate transporter substrate binding protein [Fusobacterium sp. JB019]|nr:tripartite tricarboxylate transporter substrate binding protein [Fusobacterium sp. JB019]